MVKSTEFSNFLWEYHVWLKSIQELSWLLTKKIDESLCGDKGPTKRCICEKQRTQRMSHKRMR